MAMNFCPDCANMLLYESATKERSKERSARLYCPTCAYQYPIEEGVKIKTSARLEKKPMTAEVSCPNCEHCEANFVEVMRSPDKPMDVFYTCIKCEHAWKKN